MHFVSKINWNRYNYLQMSSDDTILVIRTLNPNRKNGGPTYLYRVVWVQAAENYGDIEHVKKYVPQDRVTASRQRALVIAHNMQKRHHTEYGVSEMSHDVEY